MWVWQSQAPAGMSKFTGVDGCAAVAKTDRLRMVTSPAAMEASKIPRRVSMVVSLLRCPRFWFCAWVQSSRLSRQRTRRADQGGIIFGLGSGRQQLAVFQSDPRIEFEATRFAIERPHRAFESMQQTRQLNLGVLQDFHDLTHSLRARQKFLLVDFDQYPKAAAGVGMRHEFSGVGGRPQARLDANAFFDDKIDAFAGVLLDQIDGDMIGLHLPRPERLLPRPSPRSNPPAGRYAHGNSGHAGPDGLECRGGVVGMQAFPPLGIARMDVQLLCAGLHDSPGIGRQFARRQRGCGVEDLVAVTVQAGLKHRTDSGTRSRSNVTSTAGPVKRDLPSPKRIVFSGLHARTASAGQLPTRKFPGLTNHRHARMI